MQRWKKIPDFLFYENIFSSWLFFKKNQTKLNRLLLQMANKKLCILFLCIKIEVVNLEMTARFPRASDLTLTSLWRLFPGYFLLLLLSAVTCLFPKLCAPIMPNTSFQPHWDKKDCDEGQVFVLKSTCTVRKDPLRPGTWVHVFTEVDSSPSQQLN